MNLFEQPPSKHWQALRQRGEIVAEVWFKPEGEPLAVAFRIPRKSFQLPGPGQRLTAECLLKAVGVAADEVESWSDGGVSPPGTDAPDSGLRRPLPPPQRDAADMTIVFCLKPPRTVAPDESRAPEAPEATGEGAGVAADERGEPEIPETTWQDLEGRWKAIEGQEAAVDCLRIRLERIVGEMEASLNMALTVEEKVHALNRDVAHWSKTKVRVQFALPKARDFIHRATWATGSPERKQLGEVFGDETRPRFTSDRAARLRDRLENLLKDRQVLFSLGVAVGQDCERITADVQGALRTLQSNAAAKAREARNAARAGGKFFKDVRKLSGAG